VLLILEMDVTAVVSEKLLGPVHKYVAPATILD
jgi:hypothetical protein